MPTPARLLASIWSFALFFAASAHADLDTSAKFKIIASNYPLAYFAERIAGTRATIVMPAPEGEDPAFWKPSARDIAEMQKADLILINGADYEKWLTRTSLPRLKLIDTSSSFKGQYIVIENEVTHSHGPGGMHSHAGTAFTTWLDLKQAEQQADSIAEALVKKRPELKNSIMERLAALKTDLERLDAELKKLTSNKSNPPLLASHPIYQYLARRYGLNLQSVHWEPNEMPPTDEWRALSRQQATHAARWMLWEAEPATEIVQRLKSMGISSVVYDPCANRPKSGDFLSVMTQNVAHLKQAVTAP